MTGRTARIHATQPCRLTRWVDRARYRRHDGGGRAGETLGTLVEHNLAIGAGDDGIDVDSPATTITANLALRNGDLGIDAVPGVTDGAGNVARGNGDAAQCTNVACD